MFHRSWLFSIDCIDWSVFLHEKFKEKPSFWNGPKNILYVRQRKVITELEYFWRFIWEIPCTLLKFFTVLNNVWNWYCLKVFSPDSLFHMIIRLQSIYSGKLKEKQARSSQIICFRIGSLMFHAFLELVFYTVAQYITPCYVKLKTNKINNILKEERLDMTQTSTFLSDLGEYWLLANALYVCHLFQITGISNIIK